MVFMRRRMNWFTINDISFYRRWWQDEMCVLVNMSLVARLGMILIRSPVPHLQHEGFVLLWLRGVGLTSGEDRILIPFTEFVCRAEDPRVGKIHLRKGVDRGWLVLSVL